MPRIHLTAPSLAVLCIVSCLATRAAAEDSTTPRVSGGASSSDGVGVVGHKKCTAGNLTAEAWGCYGQVDGNDAIGGYDPDVGVRAVAGCATIYKWIGTGQGGTWSWNALGTMNWTGRVALDTMFDGDASADGAVVLVYSGDLTLTGAGAVAATSGATGESEVTWTISVTPSFQQKLKRAKAVKSESVSGGDACQNSGKGNSVTVRVVAHAEGSIHLDTNALGFGYASADLHVHNRGALEVAITFTPDPTSGDSGGQAAPGGSATTPSSGGGGGGGPTTPGGEKTWRVKVDCMTITVEQGEIQPLAFDYAAEPVPEPTPRTGEDQDGNLWWPADQPEPERQ